MTDKDKGYEKLSIDMSLDRALEHRKQSFIRPLFDSFELNQSDVDFVNSNITTNSAEALNLTLKWISGRVNSVYRKEFMEEMSGLRKAVNSANEIAKDAENRAIAAEKQAIEVGKQDRNRFWLTFGLSVFAVLVSVVTAIIL